MVNKRRFSMILVNIVGPIAILVFIISVLLCMITLGVFGLDVAFGFLSHDAGQILKTIFYVIFGIGAFCAFTIVFIADRSCLNCSGVGFVTELRNLYNCPHCNGAGIILFGPRKMKLRDDYYDSDPPLDN